MLVGVRSLVARKFLLKAESHSVKRLLKQRVFSYQKLDALMLEIVVDHALVVTG